MAAPAFLNRRGYKGEAGLTAAADLARRKAAEKRADHTLLGVDDVRGEYDTKRLLLTTLGGRARSITTEDLKKFSSEAKRLKSKFKLGITAQSVVDLSASEDRDRATRQIRVATAVGAANGVMHFVTNAGPDSDVRRHHVHVEFPSFQALVNAPQDAKKAGYAMLKGGLRFECDCGRFTFWYRYMATTGGYVHGRRETAFPKIRNPGLSGVACKHALRVMWAILRDAQPKNIAVQMIEAGRRSLDRSVVKVSVAEARDVAARQAKGRVKVAAKNTTQKAILAENRAALDRQAKTAKLKTVLKTHGAKLVAANAGKMPTAQAAANLERIIQMAGPVPELVAALNTIRNMAKGK